MHPIHFKEGFDALQKIKSFHKLWHTLLNYVIIKNILGVVEIQFFIPIPVITPQGF
jgi:hypothetical protein